MKDEKVEQLQKQFHKLYFDTTKHCQDIEKWIKYDNRKQGDIRRSLNRLTKKYESLYELKTELGKNNITEQEALNYISNDKNRVNLAQIKDRVEALYNLAGLRKPIKPIYDGVDLAEEITAELNMESSKQTKSPYVDSGFVFNIPKDRREPENQIKFSYDDSDLIISAPVETEIKPMESISDNIDLVTGVQNNKEDMPLFSLEKSREKSLTTKVKEKFGRVKEKIRNIASDFRNSKKNNTKSKGGLAKRFAALSMALTMGLFSSTTVGESTSKSEDANNNKSYTDINKVKNDFKDSIYMQALKATEETKTTVDVIENTENTESVQESTESLEENDEELFLVHANTKYTEVSDGSGNSGYFAKDTKVKDYNRALIKTCEDGSKKILEATKVGQTWEQFAEEKGIDKEEFKVYIENNENIQECVSIQSEDGKTLYGWVSIDELEKIEVVKVESMEDVER